MLHRPPESRLRLQPLLHDAVAAVRAPCQMWVRPDGTSGTSPLDGFYLGDVRLVDALSVTVDGRTGEHLATEWASAGEVGFVLLYRGLDDGQTADPDVRGEHRIRVTADGCEHTFVLRSRRGQPCPATVEVEVGLDHTDLVAIKAGQVDGAAPVTAEVRDDEVRWAGPTVGAVLRCPGATLSLDAGRVYASWPVVVPAGGEVRLHWSLRAHDSLAVVAASPWPTPWVAPDLRDVPGDLARWVGTALADLDALRLVRIGDDNEFLAAGAPWFFTLFGRDALWAARLLLPLGTSLAASTLRALAGLQGRNVVPDTAEHPGKIPHELRRATLTLPGSDVSLPPLYYGTIDATALWILLLADAASAGMDPAQVSDLLPALRLALAWLRDYGDADGDGLIEYVDESGHGLVNQGWKDSGDSVQWRDGRLATAPLALVEVQGYAYAAARAGADLLDADTPGDGDEWRGWAERLRHVFHDRFWVADESGPYPAVALDGDKRAVDSLTSNIGHLLGTGLLDADQARLVADRLLSPQMCSGYGLRTLATTSAGYWPLSYHGGSVWPHDTAIAVDGLVREGFVAEARTLASGLVRAATGFSGRIPELYSGDDDSRGVPVPYPAACRPQAWSAAAAVTALVALG